MVNRIFFLIIVATQFLYSCNSNDKKNGEEKQEAISNTLHGEQLFKINCSQCHQPTQDFTGPALKGATDRWKDKALLYEYVKNSQTVIAKDAYAKALFTKWNDMVMQPFPHLSNDDIDAILEYCNTATE
ncbi:MAG: cytochrome c [Ferruginibacter sp.]